MPKPNTNEKGIAKRTISLLKRSAKEVDDLNLFIVCNERDEPYIANGASARNAIALAIGELNKLLDLPSEVPANVPAAEG